MGEETMSNEKREAIVRAVDELKGKLPPKNLGYYGYDKPLLLKCIVTKSGYREGAYYDGCTGFNKKTFEEVCTPDEFTQVARELGWCNGYKWGVEYPANGNRPDLADDVKVHVTGKIDSNDLHVESAIWENVKKFRIVDGRYKPKPTSKPEVDNWYERSELPPVGEVREGYINHGTWRWARVEILKQHPRECAVEALDLGVLKWCDKFRPIQSHRDKVLASAEHAIESKTGEPANSTHLGILYDIGALKLPGDN